MDGFQFKIKNENIEFEIEGSEQFITAVLSVLPQLNQELLRKSVPDSVATNADDPPKTIEDILNLDFLYWKKAFNNSDEIISFVFAGYYLQRKSKDNYFTTKEVFSLLYANGILITDIYKCEMKNLEVKNIIKAGILKGKPKFRINPDSETIKLIHEILEAAFL